MHRSCICPIENHMGATLAPHVEGLPRFPNLHDRPRLGKRRGNHLDPPHVQQRTKATVDSEEPWTSASNRHHGRSTRPESQRGPWLPDTHSGCGRRAHCADPGRTGAPPCFGLRRSAARSSTEVGRVRCHWLSSRKGISATFGFFGARLRVGGPRGCGGQRHRGYRMGGARQPRRRRGALG